MQAITWVKFQRDVLPHATKIEFMTPSFIANYAALLTAEDLDAPPILQWDHVDKRNPISWYLYHNGSSAEQWSLRRGDYCSVTAISLQPNPDYVDHQGAGVFFVLEGAKDTRYKGAGLGLFPEMLKSELYEVRATIEAYSKAGTLSGYEETNACGLLLQKSSVWNAQFRVRTGDNSAIYRLDRWE
jgi:hypothetical protein